MSYVTVHHYTIIVANVDRNLVWIGYVLLVPDGQRIRMGLETSWGSISTERAPSSAKHHEFLFGACTGTGRDGTCLTNS